MTTQRSTAGERPAVRDAIRALDQKTRPREERVVIRPEDVPGKALFWRVVIQPWIPKYDGTLDLPDITEKAQEIASCVGQVLQIGSMAFQSRTTAGLVLSDEPNLPKVGQYVLHEPYAGTERELKTAGDRSKVRKIRIINDTDVLMVTDTPDEFRGYI